MAPRKTTPKATYSNKNKGAPKAAPGTSLSAAQKYLGLIQNSKGQWVRPNAAQATDYLGRVAARSGSHVIGQGFTYDFQNRQGQSLGTLEADTGIFSLAGRAPGAGPTRGKPGTRKRGKRGGNAAAGRGLNEPLSPSPYAESDIATTSYIRTQGKAYAAGRAGQAGTAAGATAAPTAKKKPARKKGMLKKKGRAGSVMRPTIKISKSGKVIPNKGGRRKSK